MRTCTSCKRELEFSAFSLADRKTGRLRGDCRECTYAKKNVRESRDPERAAARRRVVRLRYKYGIEPEEYDRLADDQDGRCAICKKHTEPLHVDHDHSTGLVRGLLCHKCNAGIGLLEDNIETLESAIVYLKEK